MKICSSCNTRSSEINAKFCSNCGHPFEKKSSKIIGNTRLENLKFKSISLNFIEKENNQKFEKMLSRIKISKQKLEKNDYFKEFLNSIKALLQNSDSPKDIQVKFGSKCLYSLNFLT